MRVLLIADFRVVHSVRYLQLLRKAKCDVFLLDYSRQTSDLVGDGRHYRCWPRSGHSFFKRFPGRFLSTAAGDALVRFQLRRIWNSIKPDLCHVQWIDNRAWLMATSGVGPVVLTAWGTDITSTQLPDHDQFQLRCKAEALTNANLLIADSHHVISIAQELAGEIIPSILLPIGVDTTLFQPLAKVRGENWRIKLKIPPNTKLVLSPRAFKRAYGHESIVKAFGRAVKGLDLNAYLVLKTYDLQDKSYLQDVLNTASSSEVSDRVRILEKVRYEELPSLYAEADFVVNFPEMDAFPVTFLECLACEVPILTNRLPAYLDYDVERFLRFVEASTEESLADGFTAMFREIDSIGASMKGAHDVIRQSFDENVIANSLAEAYGRILKSYRN